MTGRNYFPLWCKSNFSFLEGASHPEELVETCAALGLEGMALTDRDGVYSKDCSVCLATSNALRS